MNDDEMMLIMMRQMESVYVEDPSRTRIMQWTDIDNPDGMSSFLVFYYLKK